jgi:hypothetical protein
LLNRRRDRCGEAIRMMSRTAWIIAIALWAVGLAPGALIMMWLGAVDWSLRGFAIAYVVLGLIAIGYEFVVRFVERLLQRRRARRGAPSASEH